MNRKSHEKELVGVVHSVRSEFANLLRQRGLFMEDPEIVIMDADADTYSSEIRIDIKDTATRQLVDFLEFFAFENGEIGVTAEILRPWLVEQVAALRKDVH